MMINQLWLSVTLFLIVLTAINDMSTGQTLIGPITPGPPTARVQTPGPPTVVQTPGPPTVVQTPGPPTVGGIQTPGSTVGGIQTPGPPTALTPGPPATAAVTGPPTELPTTTTPATTTTANTAQTTTRTTTTPLPSPTVFTTTVVTIQTVTSTTKPTTSAAVTVVQTTTALVMEQSQNVLVVTSNNFTGFTSTISRRKRSVLTMTNTTTQSYTTTSQSYITTNQPMNSISATSIANTLGTNTSRITNITTSQDSINRTLSFQFTVLPDMSQPASNLVGKLVTTWRINNTVIRPIVDANNNSLHVIQIFNWTDNGVCPVTTCQGGQTCRFNRSYFPNSSYYCAAGTLTSINNQPVTQSPTDYCPTLTCLVPAIVVPVVLGLIIIILIIVLICYCCCNSEEEKLPKPIKEKKEKRPKPKNEKKEKKENIDKTEKRLKKNIDNNQFIGLNPIYDSVVSDHGAYLQNGNPIVLTFDGDQSNNVDNNYSVIGTERSKFGKGESEYGEITRNDGVDIFMI